jgi:hypothetical protein
MWRLIAALLEYGNYDSFTFVDQLSVDRPTFYFSTDSLAVKTAKKYPQLPFHDRVRVESRDLCSHVLYDITSFAKNQSRRVT